MKVFDRLFSGVAKGKESGNPLSGLSSEDLRLIQSLIDRAREKAKDKLQAKIFLEENKEIIEKIRLISQEKILQKIIELIQENQSLIQVLRTPEIRPVISKSGQLSSAARGQLVRHTLLGTSPPPLRTRDEDVNDKEVRQIPELKVVYVIRLDSSTIEGTKVYENYKLLAASIASINPTEINLLLKEHGFGVGTIKFEIRMILVGAIGSQVGSIDTICLSEANVAATAILDELREVSQNIHTIEDDGIGLTPSSRIVMTADDVIQESQKTATIPIIDSVIIWHINRKVGSIRKTSRAEVTNVPKEQKTTTILISDNHDLKVNNKPLYEEEVYV